MGLLTGSSVLNGSLFFLQAAFLVCNFDSKLMERKYPMPRGISTDFHNTDLLRKLNDDGVSFVLVGGGAVAAYGCRDDLYLTELDILIDPAIENAKRVIGALSASGMKLWISAVDLAGPKKQLPVKQLLFDMDILTPGVEESFSAILERSGHMMVGDVEVRVIARDDLIAMKRIAANKPDPESEKHKRDLGCLER
jgi:predicted nucleotidyltransferase